MPKAPHPLDVVLRPLITEKATRLAGESKYAFEVRVHANKVQIKEAVEKGFNVSVVSVNVMNMKGKPKRVRGNRIKHERDWKKAVVTLVPGDKIELFEGV
jgi:large subunit ribosomal protein L23